MHFVGDIGKTKKKETKLTVLKTQWNADTGQVHIKRKLQISQSDHRSDGQARTEMTESC